MKITVENYGVRITVEMHQDVPFDEIARALKGIFKSFGFHENTIDKYIKTEEE